MMDLLIATNNAGKMREFRALLAALPARLRFPAEIGLQIEVVEDGLTYADNARLKAQAYARALSEDMLVMADDSGLEVDALGGAPGVRSARYTVGSDTDRLTNLLRHMEGIPTAQRTARFRCVIAIAAPGGHVYIAEGVCEGVIGTQPAGAGGFGYDPVFIIPEQDCTMAELAPEVKNQISHRARAVQAALPLLRPFFEPGRET